MLNDHRKTKELINIILNQKAINGTDSLIQLAENNRVLLTLAKRVGNKKILNLGNFWIKKLNSTLIFCKKVLGRDINWLVTRTFKYIPYVTFDVDIYIPQDEFKKAIEKFENSGCGIKSHDNSLGGRIPGAQVNVFKEGLLTIDLHKNFTWQKREFIDTSLLFQKKRSKYIAGLKVDIPSPEVELLLCLSDIGHERFNITLLDLIWLKGLSIEIKDWQIIFQQPQKYGWNRVFKHLSRMINGMAIDIYGKEIIPRVGNKKGEYELPYFLPLYVCWLSFIENILHRKNFPIIPFLYMHYCRARYYLSGKKKMPFYEPIQ